jgi:hypothetical protein
MVRKRSNIFLLPFFIQIIEFINRQAEPSTYCCIRDITYFITVTVPNPLSVVSCLETLLLLFSIRILMGNTHYKPISSRPIFHQILGVHLRFSIFCQSPLNFHKQHYTECVILPMQEIPCLGFFAFLIWISCAITEGCSIL